MAAPHFDRASERLKNYKHQVVESWVETIRNKISIAAHTDRVRLIDNFPEFIEDMAFALQRVDSPSVIDISIECEKHAHQRATQTELTLVDMIEEYQLLRTIILETLWHHGPLRHSEVRSINQSIDDAICRAVSVFERERVDARSREQVLANIFLKSTTGPFFILDHTWRFIYVNQAALQQSQRKSKAEMIGKNFWDLYPEYMGSKTEKKFRAAMSRKRPGEFEVYQKSVDKWYLIECFPNELGISVQYRDISDRVAAEENLIQQKTLLESVIETMPAAVQIIDAKTGDVLISNKEMDLLMNGEAQSNFWKVLERTQIFRDDNTPFDYSDYPAVRALNGETVKDFEALYHRPDGGLGYFLISSSPIKNDKGEVTHIVSVSTDVGELKRIQQKLSESNRDLSIYSATVAHDLKSPVNTMVSMTELLEEKNQFIFDEESKELMQFIVAASRRMQRLIDNLLSYAKVNQEKQPFAPVDLNLVLNDVRNNLIELINENKVEIRYHELPTINGDEVQMMSLFQNLISNAIKFRSGEPPVIEIHWEERPHCYRLVVRDNGIGFESEKSKELFEPFTRLESSVSYEGTGLGLAICKRIVERHHGRIWAESSPGCGATFYIEIPKK